MYTLGPNAAYHDPATCLVWGGQALAAAEEGRFTHVKHGKRPILFSTYELPFNAIDYCLREVGIRLTDVEHIAYSYYPFLLLGCHTGQETIELPLEPSAHLAPVEWENPWDPLFLPSIVNAPRRLDGGWAVASQPCGWPIAMRWSRSSCSTSAMTSASRACRRSTGRCATSCRRRRC